MMFELLFDVDGPFPKHLDYFCPHIGNLSLQYFNPLRIEVRTRGKLDRIPTERLLGVAMCQKLQCQARCLTLWDKHPLTRFALHKLTKAA